MIFFVMYALTEPVAVHQAVSCVVRYASRIPSRR